MANVFTFIWNCCCPSVQEQHCALTIICCALMVKFWGKSSTWAIKAQLIPAVLMGQAIHWWQLRKEWYQKYKLTCSNVMPTVLIRSGCFVSWDWQEIYFLINDLQLIFFFFFVSIYSGSHFTGHTSRFFETIWGLIFFFSNNHILVQTELVLGTWTLLLQSMCSPIPTSCLPWSIHIGQPVNELISQSAR